MRKLKELPSVAVDREDYEFVEESCRRLFSEARVVAADGTALYFPDSGGKYRACWLRDFCYMVEGAGSLLPAEEILSVVDYFLARQREDGVMPDRVRPDGEAVYQAGPEDQPLGLGPPADNAQFLVKLLDAYYVLTGDAAAFLERSGALFRALGSVPLNLEGLVAIDANRPHPGYGFTDMVAKTGKELFSSLLYWEASRRLAQRLQELEEHEDARTWFEAADLAINHLPELYDEPNLMYWAASEGCHQHDLWGTMYAVVIRVVSKTRSRSFAEFLREHRQEVFYQGHVRHLLRGEYWRKLLGPVERDRYQNGGYWAVPSGWAVQTVALVDPGLARELVHEVVDLWREEGVYECIGPDGYREGPGYVASATNLLGAIRPL